MPCRATARPSSRICSPEVRHLDERVGQYDVHVRAMARDSTSAQQLMQIVGIGEVTATAIVATVGNAREFSSSRQFAAWLGLVPRAVQLGWHDTPGPRSPRALRSPCQLERGRNARSSAPASFVSCVPLGAIAALTHEFLPPRD
jgi:hypothetical protein